MTAQQQSRTFEEEHGSKAMLGISMAQARELVSDLAPRREWIYWTDLLVSLTVGYGAFFLCPADQLLSPLGAGCVLFAGFALYRAVLFVHEIVHAGDELRWFSVFWHAVCGIPMFVPKFFYELHQDHHTSRTYATAKDGEYVPYANWPRWRVCLLPLTALFAPPLFVARFLVLAPLGWLCPPLRRWLLERASALVIDAEFQRKMPARGAPRSWFVQEVLCFAYTLALAALFAAGAYRVTRLAEAYLVIMVFVFVNWIRVLAAHRYESDEKPMTFSEQILDSIDHPGSPVLGELWAPLGLRLHAVHHLFPSLAYHRLPEARRRLAAAVGVDGSYWSTEDPSLFASLKRLLARPRDTVQPPQKQKELA
jgi:fatty acid desaturase